MPARYDPQKHHRRSIRLKGYDYTQPGAYFVAIVAWGRQEIFGQIRDRNMALSPIGQVVMRTWQGLPRYFPNVVLGEFCVMPSHVHGIIQLVEPDWRWGGSITTPVSEPDPIMNKRGQEPAGGETRPYPMRHGLPEIVRAFKSYSARQINYLRHTAGSPVWQRNYYERVVRNEEELRQMADYISNNPLGWDTDDENPHLSSSI
jgi:putative transposase